MSLSRSGTTVKPPSRMKIGASFSHRHLKSLGIDPQKALEEFSSLGFGWIRLGCYWDEIEPREGKFNFSALSPLLDFCQNRKMNVILTVGMKAPRFPEYYLPKWLKPKIKLGRFSKIGLGEKRLAGNLFSFLEQSVLFFQRYSCIRVWQVENEPLDPSGEKLWRIDKELLAKEIEVVRGVDNNGRRIMINMGGLLTFLPIFWRSIFSLNIDILGFDLYFKKPYILPGGKVLYGRNFLKVGVEKLAERLRKKGKEIWIAELQTEPWEPDELVTQKENPPSFLPRDLKRNYKIALGFSPKGILCWGFEYWIWRKLQGDFRYWNSAIEFFC